METLSRLSKKKIKRTAIFALCAFLFFFLGWTSASYYTLKNFTQDNQASVTPFDTWQFFQQLTPSSQAKADLGVFWQVWDIVSSSYVNEEAVDVQNMVYGAIKGMVASLNDDYTLFLTPEESQEFEKNFNGDLEGIGAELTIRNGFLTVEYPLKDSPAEKAGLLSNDIIYKIDQVLTEEMSLYESVSKIRGEKGTKVVLTIVREETNAPFDVEIIRDSFNVQSVTLEEPEQGIYRININRFNEKTTPEFQNIITKIAAQNPKGIILDLRNNGGGLVESSIDVLSTFLEGKVAAVSVQQRDPSKNEIFYVSGKPTLPSIPLVVLINEGSASASEIVAGALQDYKRALVIGEKSYGKGSVQEVIENLPDGSTLRITIARWYTPNGRSIDHEGIEPDRIVELTKEDFDQRKDPQLDAAVEYLRNTSN